MFKRTSMVVVALLLGLDNAEAVQLKSKAVNEYFLSEDYLQTAANNDAFADDDEDLVQLSKKTKKHHKKENKGIRAQVGSQHLSKAKAKSKGSLIDAKKTIAKQQGISLGLLLAIENYDKQVAELKDVRDYVHKIVGELNTARADLKGATSQKVEDAAREDVEMLESGLPAAQKDLNQAEADVNDATHRILAESKAMKSQATNYEGVFEEMKKAIDDLQTSQLELFDKRKAVKSAKGAHNKDITQDSADRARIFVTLAKNAFEAADAQLHAFQRDETANGLPDDPEVKDSVMDSEDNMKKYLEELNGIMEDAEDDVKEARDGADSSICSSSKDGADRIKADHACNLLQLELTKLDVTLFTARRRLADFEKASKCSMHGKLPVCEKRPEPASDADEAEAAPKTKKEKKQEKKDQKKAAADAEKKEMQEADKNEEASQTKDAEKAQASSGLFKIMKADDEAEKLRTAIRTKQGELSDLEDKLKALKSTTEKKLEDAQKKSKKADAKSTEVVTGDRMRLKGADDGSSASKATKHTRQVAGMGPLDRSGAPNTKVIDPKTHTIDDVTGKEAPAEGAAAADSDSDVDAAAPKTGDKKKNCKDKKGKKITDVPSDDSESTEESGREAEADANAGSGAGTSDEKTDDDLTDGDSQKTNDVDEETADAEKKLKADSKKDAGAKDKKKAKADENKEIKEAMKNREEANKQEQKDAKKEEKAEAKQTKQEKKEQKKINSNSADDIGDAEGASGEDPAVVDANKIKDTNPGAKKDDAPAKKDDAPQDDKKEEAKPDDKAAEQAKAAEEKKKADAKAAEDKKKAEEDKKKEAEKKAEEDKKAAEKKAADDKKAEEKKAKEKEEEAKKKEEQKDMTPEEKEAAEEKDKAEKEKKDEKKSKDDAKKAEADKKKDEKKKEKEAKEKLEKEQIEEDKKSKEADKANRDAEKKAKEEGKKAAEEEKKKNAEEDKKADAERKAKAEEKAKTDKVNDELKKKIDEKSAKEAEQKADGKQSLNAKFASEQANKVSADLFAQKSEPTEATLIQLQETEYPQPDIRGPMPQNAHPDSTFSSHVHNDWTYVQQHANLVDYPTPEQRGETSAMQQAYEGEYIEDKRLFSFEEPGDY